MPQGRLVVPQVPLVRKDLLALLGLKVRRVHSAVRPVLPAPKDLPARLAVLPVLRDQSVLPVLSTLLCFSRVF